VEITGITGDENVGVNLLRVLKLVKGDLLMKERKDIKDTERALLE
jgi:hypothetical protein